MQSDVDQLNILNIAGGALPERIDDAVQRVLANIADLNTDPEAKRKIVVTVTFSPFKDRSGALVDLAVESKGASPEAVSGTIYIQKRGGQISAFTHDPRQEQLFRHEAPATPTAQ